MPRLLSHLAPLSVVPLACMLACAFPGSLRAAPPPAPGSVSGAGPVVCEPVGSGPDADFGAGCALWLQMEVGGQGAMGKTPSWAGLNRARAELGRDDLRLSAAEAAPLAGMLGATHAAVGTLSGAGTSLTLTYQIVSLPAGTPVGAALTLSGTRDQIVAGLPGLAKTLAERLGAASPNVPASVGLSPAELETLAANRRGTLTDAQETALFALAARDPLAGLVVLSRRPDRTQAQENAAPRTLLSQAPDNPLVWEAVAGMNTKALISQAARLDALALRFPHNHLLDGAQVFRARATDDRKAEQKAASRMVADAPGAPNDWLRYAETLSNQADDVRHGRISAAMPPAEEAIVTALYPRQQTASMKATALDPTFTRAWLGLAEAATAAGDTVVADRALGKARTLSLPPHTIFDEAAAVVEWALQMYQPKWGGSPAKLAEFANFASEQDGQNDQVVQVFADSLGTLTQDAGVEGLDGKALQKKLLDAHLIRKRAAAVARPGDSRSHLALAKALWTSGDVPGALTEYRTACGLLPKSAVARFDLGYLLHYQLETQHYPGTYDEAITRLQEAVQIDPDYLKAYLELNYCLKNTGRFAEATQALKQALQLDPKSGPTYAALAEVQMRQKDYAEAIINYRKALSLGDYREPSYQNLITALGATGQYDAILETAQAELRLFPKGNSLTYDEVAAIYVEKKLWDRSIAASKAALALDGSDAWAHENLAEAYLGAGRLAEARTEWQTVLTLKDDDLKTTARGYLKKYP